MRDGRHGQARALGILVLVTMAAAAGAGRAGAPEPVASEPRELELWSAAESRLVRRSRVEKTPAEWQRELAPQAHRVLRQQGTERAFTSPLLHEHQKGVFQCAGCGTDLFASEAKFDSGTGWPSFAQPIHPANVATEEDSSLLMTRTEVHCPRCGGHLGHVFEDGPRPTGLRYCINGAALRFVPAK